jgi:hypothetical protein
LYTPGPAATACNGGVGTVIASAAPAAVGTTSSASIAGFWDCDIQGGASSGTIYFACYSNAGMIALNVGSTYKYTGIPMTTHSWVIYVTVKYSAATAGNWIQAITTETWKIN